jgi:hypothetical protein
MLQVSTSDHIVVVVNLHGHPGAGNSFLGGLAAGLHLTGDIVEGDLLLTIKLPTLLRHIYLSSNFICFCISILRD